MLSKNFEASKPRSLEGSSCLGGNREAKSIKRKHADSCTLHDLGLPGLTVNKETLALPPIHPARDLGDPMGW